MPTPQAHYSYAELEGLWISAGGPRRMAPTMAAIAEAESQGYSHAYNKSGASGLWQILGAPTGWTGSTNWFDPETNARAAVAKWKASGLSPWVTWPNPARGMIRRGVTPVLPSGGQVSPGIPYGNPLRRVSNLTAGRIDQGVDYTGTGPIYALGPGVITYAGTGNTGWGPPAGWTPGGYVKERLTAGPLAGHSVYVAEGITPTVRVGQRVTSASQIATMTGPIETGFAAPGAGTAALAQSQFSGSNPTAYGVAYSSLLSQLGAPRGVGPTAGGTGAGSSGWPPPWLTGILAGVDKFFGGTGAGGASAAGGGPFGGIAQSINNVAGTLSGLASAIDWLFHPENWVRIIAGIGGGVLIIIGLNTFRHIGGPSSTTVNLGPAGALTVPEASGNMALALGIGEVGFGAALLFVAFHNLEAPGSSSYIGETLGQARDQLQAQSAGGAQPVMAGGGGGPQSGLNG